MAASALLAEDKLPSYKARLHIVSYNSSPLEGARVRARGRFHNAELWAYRNPGAKIEEMQISDEYVEFTIPNLEVYAVVDLW